MTEIKKEVRVILKRKGKPLKQQGNGPSEFNVDYQDDEGHLQVQASNYP